MVVEAAQTLIIDGVERLWLRPAEVGRVLGYSRSVVYDLISTGALPKAPTDGRSIRVAARDVLAYALRVPEAQDEGPKVSH